MKNTTGQPVRGDDFFDRGPELAELWHMVARDHVLMLAPRRVGKTSLLLRMADQPRHGWQTRYLDVEAVGSEAQFVARLLTKVYELKPDGAFWASVGGGAAKVLNRIGRVGLGPLDVELGKAIGGDWQSVGDAMLRLVGGLGKPTLLMVDEFPIFVRRLLGQDRGEERTRLLLDWFRGLRIDPQLGDAKVHFLLAGSIGLDAVVSKVGMSGTINDLRTFRLGELSEKEADALLQGLAEGEGFDIPAEVRARILCHISWRIPYHLQLMFDQLFRWVRYHGRELTPALAYEAYEALLSPMNRKHFSHWEERLRDPLLDPQERDLMAALLAAAARDPRGATEDTLRQIRSKVAPDLDEKLALVELERDGYLTLDGDRWRFASSMLRDWWLRWKVEDR